MRALLLLGVLGWLARGSPVSEPAAAPAPAPAPAPEAAAEAAAEAHYGHYGYGRSIVLPTVWGASYGSYGLPWGRRRREAGWTRAKRNAAALPDPEPVADPNPEADAHYGYYGYGYGYAPYYGYSCPYYGHYY